jgi:hypothetical protein
MKSISVTTAFTFLPLHYIYLLLAANIKQLCRHLLFPLDVQFTFPRHNTNIRDDLSANSEPVLQFLAIVTGCIAQLATASDFLTVRITYNGCA